MSRFEHINVRQGNVQTQRVFTARCSQCGTTRDFSSNKPMPDEPVMKAFKRWGWLLGRNKAHDLCPTCVGIEPKHRLAEKFRVSDSDGLVPRAREIVESAEEARAEQASETARILDTHFPANPTDAPMKESSPSVRTTAPSAPVVASPLTIVQTGLTLEQTLDLARALDRMSQSLAAVASGVQEALAALELMTEQQGKHQQQVVNALAGIVPAITRSGEGMTSRLDALAERLTAAPAAPTPADVAERTGYHEPLGAQRLLERELTSLVNTLDVPPHVLRETLRRELSRVEDEAPVLPANIVRGPFDPTKYGRTLPQEGPPEATPQADTEADTPAPAPHEATAVGKAFAQFAERQSATGPAPAQELNGKKTRRRHSPTAEASVTTSVGATGRPWTCIRIDRRLWEKAGLPAERGLRVKIEYDAGENVVVVPDPKGVRVKEVTPHRVVLQTTLLGIASEKIGFEPSLRLGIRKLTLSRNGH